MNPFPHIIPMLYFDDKKNNNFLPPQIRFFDPPSLTTLHPTENQFYFVYFIDPVSDSLFDRTYNDERFMQDDAYQNYNYRHNGRLFNGKFYFILFQFFLNFVYVLTLLAINYTNCRKHLKCSSGQMKSCCFYVL